MSDGKVCKEWMSPKDLLDYLLNPNIPKNEAEHFAVRLIEKLEQKLKEKDTLITELHSQIEKLKEQMECRYSGECDYKSKKLTTEELIKLL